MNKKKVKNNPKNQDIRHELFANYVADKAKVYMHECMGMGQIVGISYEHALGVIHAAMMAVVVATVTVEKQQKSKNKGKKK